MHLQVATSGEAVGGSRYRTLGRLGSGGMAEVDLALQTGVAGSSRLCVLKRVRQDLAGRHEFVSMFFEEARISASLNHPNIVQIYEVGGDEQDCFLAMEFLRGRSYAHVQHIATGAVLDYRIALEVMLATLSGLEHAHERRDLSGEPMRLVHRDISPPNVLITYEGEIKLLDFGVAKSKDSLVKTEAGVLKGKVAYMAPEMVAGDPFDARADLYAVGVMLWEATAGRDRWPRMNDVAILSQIARGGPVESPGAAERGLPALADSICIEALAEDPEQRYQSAAQFRNALLELCEAVGGRLGQLEIKDYMGRHFAADRAREAREIEAALQAQRITPAGSRVSDAEVGGFTKRVKRAVLAKAPALVVGEPSLIAEEVTPLPSPSPRGRMSLAVAVAVVLLLGVVAFRLLQSAAPVAATKAVESRTPAAELMATAAPLVAPLSVASMPTSTSTPEPVAPVAKSGHAARVHAGKPSKVASAPTSPAPADTKPAAGRSLQLDRQDPWKE